MTNILCHARFADRSRCEAVPAHGGAATILIRGNSSNTLTADGTHLRGSVSTSSRATPHRKSFRHNRIGVNIEDDSTSITADYVNAGKGLTLGLSGETTAENVLNVLRTIGLL